MGTDTILELSIVKEKVQYISEKPVSMSRIPVPSILCIALLFLAPDLGYAASNPGFKKDKKFTRTTSLRRLPIKNSPHSGSLLSYMIVSAWMRLGSTPKLSGMPGLGISN